LEETLHVAGLLFGEAGPAHWRAAKRPFDFYDAKGIISDLLSGFNELRWLPFQSPKAGQTPSDPLFHPKASLRLKLPRGIFATVGLLHPTVARAWGLDKHAPALFDLRLDLLADLEAPAQIFKPYSALPGSSRDISFLIPLSVSYADIEAALLSCKRQELRSIELIDVFQGKGVPQGQQSMTLRLSFQRDDRTLKDIEVTASVEALLQALSSKHGAVLRS
jgi:phenylalanyl-tRNA synthetase beta chain